LKKEKKIFLGFEVRTANGGSKYFYIWFFLFLYSWPPASHPAQRWRQEGIPHVLKKTKKCWTGGVLYAIN